MIDKAERVENGYLFESGVVESVSMTTVDVTAVRKPGAGKEVERILREQDKPLHLRLIMAELAAAGFTNTYQTMSGILQILSKKKKVFKKVAPATYALIGYKKPVKRRIAKKATDSNPFSEKVAVATNGKEG